MPLQLRGSTSRADRERESVTHSFTILSLTLSPVRLIPGRGPIEEHSLVAVLDPLRLDELLRMRHDVVLNNAVLVLSDRRSENHLKFLTIK